MSDRPLAVILDVDGTLVDSNDQHARAWLEALAEVGVEVPFERVRRMIGMGGDKLLPKAVGLDPDAGEARQASARRAEIFKSRYLPGLRTTRGARQLLERFRTDGLRVTVASSAKPDELQSMLEHAGLRDLIETETSGEDGRSKPDPDTVEAVLQRIGEPADAVLMLGDTPYDVDAAGRAGLRTVAVRCGGWDLPELGGAIAVYDDPQAILDDYDDSPFGRRAPDSRSAASRAERPAERRTEERLEGLAEREADSAR